MLSNLFLDVLLGGFDLDPAAAHPGLVAGLGEDGWAVDNLAAAQIEARPMPGADHGIALAVPLLEGSAEVTADAGDGTDLATGGAAEQDLGPVRRDATQAVLQQLLLVQNRHESVGAARLEDVPVDAQPVMVGELAPDVRSKAAEGVPGQESQTPCVPAPRGPEDERSHTQDERDRVEKPVRHAHPSRPAAQVAPVREPGRRRGESAQYPHRYRGIGRVLHGPE